ncbi:hypothetical protein [Rubrivivax gelatinosus]|uniref:hypothetical protein n=1 Tax=Rubrivivax gelatinosus TaxID=28068 RepID=UPI0005C244D8|nr:hypothetical protein [Rubrivivax gelatinosus]MBG6083132.1 hypothetical protein [Rubrivivax gelatinosus]
MNTKALFITSILAAATGTASGAATEADVRDALEIQSSVLSIRPQCDQSFIARQEKQLGGTIARQDFITAAAQGRVMAANVAACALKAKSSLPQWADLAGRMLAMGVIADTRIPGGMTTPEVASSGDRATLLLEYAAANGSTTAREFLKALQQSNYRTFN